MAWHTAYFPVPSDHFCLTESLSSYFVVLKVHSKLWNQISQSVNYLGTQGFPARSHLRNQGLFIFIDSRPVRLWGTQTSVKRCAQWVDNEGHNIPLRIKHEELKNKGSDSQCVLARKGSEGGRVQSKEWATRHCDGAHKGECVWGVCTINTKTDEGVSMGTTLLLKDMAAFQNHKINYVRTIFFYTSPTSFIGHWGGGSCMFFFQKMFAAKWEPSNMNWYSLHTTGHIKAHITDFKFYLHANI